jgi:hypothetical protein
MTGEPKPPASPVDELEALADLAPLTEVEWSELAALLERIVIRGDSCSVATQINRLRSLEAHARQLPGLIAHLDASSIPGIGGWIAPHDREARKPFVASWTRLRDLLATLGRI